MVRISDAQKATQAKLEPFVTSQMTRPQSWAIARLYSEQEVQTWLEQFPNGSTMDDASAFISARAN
jgi:hypothetical protein